MIYANPVENMNKVMENDISFHSSIFVFDNIFCGIKFTQKYQKLCFDGFSFFFFHERFDKKNHIKSVLSIFLFNIYTLLFYRTLVPLLVLLKHLIST